MPIDKIVSKLHQLINSLKDKDWQHVIQDIVGGRPGNPDL